MKIIEYGILDKNKLSSNEQIDIVGGNVSVCGAQACAADSCWFNVCGANACITNWISFCPINLSLSPPSDPDSPEGDNNGSIIP